MEISTSSGSFNHELRWLHSLAPEFGVNGDCVKILHTPSEFHTQLIQEARSAKKRIVLASLYVGAGSLEKELIEAICLAAQDNGNDVNITILMDCIRGSRGKDNSIEILNPLFDQYGHSNKLQVNLYHTPNLRGLLKRFVPERWNELIGVAHMKVFIFDDNLIMSGANLSHDYFVNRQDRYMSLHNCPEIANYFNALIDTVGSFSFKLMPNKIVDFPHSISQHPYKGNRREFILNANKQVKHFIQSRLAPSTKVHNHCDDYCELPQNLFEKFRQYVSTSPPTRPQNIVKCNVPSIGAVDKHEFVDTWIYPTIQMGLFGIRQDEFVTKLLLKSFVPKSKVHFTTGYFNVTDDYCDTIINSDARYDILLSSPEANGFFSSKGFSKHIPQVYIHFCKKFYDSVKGAGRQSDFSLLEYARSNWTFHGKGMWYYPPGEKLPNMTVIGSTNFGLRSVHRDLEAQMILVTKNAKLRERLHREKNSMAKYTSPISPETFKQPRYFVPRWVAAVTNFIKIYF